MLKKRLATYKHLRHQDNKQNRINSAKKKGKRIAWLKEAIEKVSNNKPIDLSEIPPDPVSQEIEKSDVINLQVLYHIFYHPSLKWFLVMYIT